MPEQLRLDFEAPIENSNLSEQERLLSLDDGMLRGLYAEKVGLSLRSGRHENPDGTVDKKAIVHAILNPNEERDQIRVIDAEYEGIGDAWSGK
jgi:hypothetical protein